MLHCFSAFKEKFKLVWTMHLKTQLPPSMLKMTKVQLLNSLYVYIKLYLKTHSRQYYIYFDKKLEFRIFNYMLRGSHLFKCPLACVLLKCFTCDLTQTHTHTPFLYSSGKLVINTQFQHQVVKGHSNSYTYWFCL